MSIGDTAEINAGTIVDVVKPLKDLVVGYDFSPSSEIALHQAFEISKQTRATVHVLWSESKLSKLELTDPALEANTHQCAAALERRLELLCEARRQAGLTGGDTRLKMYVARSPNPADDIIKLAKETHAGLILLGGRERSKLGRFILGSITEEVTRRAPCSVLVARRAAQTNQPLQSTSN